MIVPSLFSAPLTAALALKREGCRFPVSKMWQRWVLWAVQRMRSYILESAEDGAHLADSSGSW